MGTLAAIVAAVSLTVLGFEANPTLMKGGDLG